MRLLDLLSLGVQRYLPNFLQLFVFDIFVLIVQKKCVVDVCAILVELLLRLLVEQADELSSHRPTYYCDPERDTNCSHL